MCVYTLRLAWLSFQNCWRYSLSKTSSFCHADQRAPLSRDLLWFTTVWYAFFPLLLQAQEHNGRDISCRFQRTFSMAIYCWGSTYCYSILGSCAGQHQDKDMEHPKIVLQLPHCLKDNVISAEAASQKLGNAEVLKVIEQGPRQLQSGKYLELIKSLMPLCMDAKTNLDKISQLKTLRMLQVGTWDLLLWKGNTGVTRLIGLAFLRLQIASLKNAHWWTVLYTSLSDVARRD